MEGAGAEEIRGPVSVVEVGVARGSGGFHSPGAGDFPAPAAELVEILMHLVGVGGGEGEGAVDPAIFGMGELGEQRPGTGLFERREQMGAGGDVAEGSGGGLEAVEFGEGGVVKAIVIGTDLAGLHGAAVERDPAEVAFGGQLEGDGGGDDFAGAVFAHVRLGAVEGGIERVLPFDEAEGIEALALGLAFAEEEGVALASEAAATGDAEGDVLEGVPGRIGALGSEDGFPEAREGGGDLLTERIGQGEIAVIMAEAEEAPVFLDHVAEHVGAALFAGGGAQVLDELGVTESGEGGARLGLGHPAEQIEIAAEAGFGGIDAIAEGPLVFEGSEEEAGGEAAEVVLDAGGGGLVKVVDVVDDLAVDAAEGAEVFGMEVADDGAAGLDGGPLAEGSFEDVETEEVVGAAEEAEGTGGEALQFGSQAAGIEAAVKPEDFVDCASHDN